MNSTLSGIRSVRLLVVAVIALLSAPVLVFAQNQNAAAQSPTPPASTSSDATSRVLVIVVDPAAAQAEVVREVIAALEKNGIARTELKTKSDQTDLPDQSEQLQVVLQLKSTESYKKIEEFIQGMANLKQVRAPRFSFKVQASGSSFVQLKAGSKVPIKEVQLVRDYLDQQTALRLDMGDETTLDAAESATPPPSATAVTPKSPFRVTLMRLKADGSHAGNAKEVEAELSAAFENSKLPQEVIDNWGPQTASFYTPQHYSQLLAWMKSRKLILKSVALKTPTPKTANLSPKSAPSTGPEVADEPNVPASHFVTSERIDYSELGLQLPMQVAGADPSLNRQAHFTWTFDYELADATDGVPIRVERRLDVMERPPGADAAVLHENLEEGVFSFDLPAGQVAMLSAFPMDQDGIYYRGLRSKGIELVFIVERDPPSSIDTDVQPQMRLPDRVFKIAGNVVRDPTWPGSSGLSNRSGMGAGSERLAAVPPSSQASTDNIAVTPTSPSTTTEAAAGETVSAVFRLQHVNAASVAEVAKLLFPQRNIIVVADTKRNSLIVRSPQGMIKELQVILRALEKPIGEKGGTTGDGAIGTEPRAITAATSREDLKRAYDEAEKRAGDLAMELRQPQAQTPQGAPRRQRLRKDLHDAVAAAFAARQRLLESEVVEVQRRAQRIRESIDLRNRIQAQIVERRVADLLNPDLKWDGTEPPRASAASAKAPLATVSAKPAEVADPRNKLVKAASDDPISAVVWMELLSTNDLDGKAVHSATYLNGTVVSSDGLIASILSPNDDEAEVLKRPGSTTVFFGNGESGTANIVAYDSQSGLVLLESSVKNQPYLLVSDSVPALNQRLRGFVRVGGTGHDGDQTSSNAEVSHAPPSNSPDVTQFRVNAAGGGSRAGSPCLNSVGQLQGLLSHSIPGGRPTAGFGGGGSTPESNFVPGFVITRLISRHRDRPIENSNKPGSANLRPGASSPAPQKAATDPALLGVWEVNYTAVDKTRVPPENPIRLVFTNRHLAVFHGTQRHSSWVVHTSPELSPARLFMDVCEGSSSQYGIYEVKGDGLRLSTFSDKNLARTAFGTQHPEFVRISRDISPALSASMQQIPPTQAELQASLSSDQINTISQTTREQAANQSLSQPLTDKGANEPRPQYSNSLILRNAEEFRRSLDEVATALGASQSRFDTQLQELRKSNPQAVDADVLKAYPLVVEELQRLRRRQQILRDELAAQIQLLEQEVADAEARLAMAEADLKRMRLLVAKKVSDQEALDVANLEAKQAERRVDAAKTLLDLYLKVEPKQSPPASRN